MKKLIIVLSFVLTCGIIWFSFSGKTDVPTTVDLLYEASVENGNLPEKIIGNLDKAELIIFEYADYSCAHCAEWNELINQLIDKYGERIALVFRGYDLGFKNSRAAALAATAAQKQNAWKEFKDILFSRLDEWYALESDVLAEKFADYFNEATDGYGDIQKYLADIKSAEVEKRVQFENQLGDDIKIRGTPTFRIDGKTIELNKLLKTIENKLK